MREVRSPTQTQTGSLTSAGFLLGLLILTTTLPIDTPDKAANFSDNGDYLAIANNQTVKVFGIVRSQP